MLKFFSWRARVVFLALLFMTISAYAWERNSPFMSAEKFYRNISITEVWPAKLSYPDTLVEARVESQSNLIQRCGPEYCYFWVVVAEKEFLVQDKVFLPMSYLPWAKKIPLSYFKLTAFVGRISREDYRRVLALGKSGNMRHFKVQRITKNPRVAKILEMHYLGIPLVVRVRPVSSGACMHINGLRISIIGNLEKLELAM